MTVADAALLRLLGLLDAAGYDFVAPTPATHARVLRNRGGGEAGGGAQGLRDALGWSLLFRSGALGEAIEGALAEADMLEADDDAGASVWRSRVRVARLHGRLYLHSAFPTDAADAVFLGPDSYRFADLIATELSGRTRAPMRVVDIGTGAGVGAIVAAGLCPGAKVVMSDINPAALRLARINAAHAGVAVAAVEGAGLGAIDGDVDLAIANPPYIVDETARSYRHGGAMFGGALSLELASEAMTRLAPDGRLILYTGSAIVDGADLLRHELENAAQQSGCATCYRELDPDVFGEELDGKAYRGVDRIALVAGVFTRTAAPA